MKPPSTSASLLHGGNLQQATALFGQPAHGWLDLSTGINPYAYPIPNIANSAWQSLPYIAPSTLQAAYGYYATDNLLLTAGSQSVIEKLPECLRTLGNKKAMLVPDIGYQEHRQSWAKQGSVLTYPGLTNATPAISAYLNKPECGHLLLINPNNPTGIIYGFQQIATWAQQLAAKQGFVVVDEAFIDATPNLSVLGYTKAQTLPENVIVLRSFGKFFGLAGIRMGAFIAAPAVRQVMATQLGTWTVNGPAQAVAQAAWQDQPWQAHMRQSLLTEASEQIALWQQSFTHIDATLQAQTPLFRSFILPNAAAQRIYRQAAQQGILLRLIPVNETQSMLRIGNVDLWHQDSINRCQDFAARIHI